MAKVWSRKGKKSLVLDFEAYSLSCIFSVLRAHCEFCQSQGRHQRLLGHNTNSTKHMALNALWVISATIYLPVFLGLRLVLLFVVIWFCLKKNF